MVNQLFDFFSVILSKDLNVVADKEERESCVAAGDPAKRIAAGGITEKQCQQAEVLKALKKLKICGNSMFPCGIGNGDSVYVEPFSEQDERKTNDFLVLAVDRDYYAYKKKVTYYDLKLRRYLMDVATDMEAEDIYKYLYPLHHAIILKKNQKRLAERLKDTRKYYKNQPLCLSITFRDGDLRYSFHPSRLIRYKVRFVVPSSAGELKDADKIMAY